jgi:pimeloyl-ACP methyl ester carboxylesterase
MNGRPAPRLEIVEWRPSAQALETPVLFVHGAYAGAWCWEEYFLPYFAERGVHGYALSLRGHGRSEGRQWLATTTLGDYVEDVERVVRGMPRPPVLVGHSMGGMIVQKYLERHADVPGVVLMASVPPQGLGLPTLRLMLCDPWLFWRVSLMQHPNPVYADFKTARRAGFSDTVPDAELRRFQSRCGPESSRAMWDMTVSDLVRPRRIRKPPMLVLGGGRDALFTPGMVQATASAYGAQAEIFPDMAHVMMLEPGCSGWPTASSIGWRGSKVRLRQLRWTSAPFVIASGAKQSREADATFEAGADVSSLLTKARRCALLRRYVPRNDGGLEWRHGERQRTLAHTLSMQLEPEPDRARQPPREPQNGGSEGAVQGG